MRLSENEIEFISRKIVKTLVAEGKLEVDDPARVVAGIIQVITDELRLEDALNEEVRQTLLEHTHHLLVHVQQGQARAREEEGHHPVKLSRERVLHLSRLIMGYLDQDDAVEYFEEPKEIRQQIVKLIEGEMKADEMIDALVRRKLETQKRVVEGSDEWEVLYRKYYEEEVARHRKVLP
jgi:uncharacterized protein